MNVQKLEKNYLTAHAKLFTARCTQFPHGALVRIWGIDDLARVVTVDPRDPFMVRVERVTCVGRSELVSVAHLQRASENQELALELPQ